jgi:hypothetical protein
VHRKDSGCLPTFLFEPGFVNYRIRLVYAFAPLSRMPAANRLVTLYPVATAASPSLDEAQSTKMSRQHLQPHCFKPLQEVI